MKLLSIKPLWVLSACAVGWTLSLITIISSGFATSTASAIAQAILPLVLFITTLLTFGSIAMFLFGAFAKDRKNEDYTQSPFTKLVAALIVLAIIVSTFTGIKSLWYSPLSNNFGDKFIYENITTSVGITGIVLTIILSALQKDIYWVARKKTIKLDERQLHERREVFETSYKLAAFIVLGAVWFINSTSGSLTTILANNHNTFPSYLHWLGVNLALTLFALPLVVAAWKRSVR